MSVAILLFSHLGLKKKGTQENARLRQEFEVREKARLEEEKQRKIRDEEERQRQLALVEAERKRKEALAQSGG
jgi:hypothetical protein